MDFKPKGRKPGLTPIADEYPVLGTLATIGLPAVKPLIEKIKTTSAQVDAERLSAEKVRHAIQAPLLAMALQEIYETGGHGARLARLRLEQEIRATQDEQARKNLLFCLGKIKTQP